MKPRRVASHLLGTGDKQSVSSGGATADGAGRNALPDAGGHGS
jgi:hypothetical protein